MLSLDARKEPMDISFDLCRKGFTLRVNRQGLWISGERTVQLQLRDVCLVGMLIVANSEESTIGFGVDPRFDRGCFVVDTTFEGRFKKGLDALSTLKASKL